MIYFEASYVRLEAPPDKPYLVGKWWGEFSHQELVHAYDVAIKAVKATGRRLLLSDVRHCPPPGSESVEYMLGEGLPKLAQVGLQKIAGLSPLDSFTQLAADHLLQYSHQYAPLLFYFFDSEAKALEWLLEEPQMP